MKKTYEKPRVYMERFELAEHIAGCSLEYDAETGTASGLIGNDYVVGLFDTEACSTILEGFCWTNAMAGLNSINS